MRISVAGSRTCLQSRKQQPARPQVLQNVDLPTTLPALLISEVKLFQAISRISLRSCCQEVLVNAFCRLARPGHSRFGVRQRAHLNATRQQISLHGDAQCLLTHLST